MDTTTTPDLTALEAEVNALLAEIAEHDARLEALLAQPYHWSITSQLAQLRVGIEGLAADTAARQAEQAEIERQIEALEQAA